VTNEQKCEAIVSSFGWERIPGYMKPVWYDESDMVRETPDYFSDPKACFGAKRKLGLIMDLMENADGTFDCYLYSKDGKCVEFVTDVTGECTAMAEALWRYVCSLKKN